MDLPHKENAWISPEKLTDYLLSETHPDGWSKAEFFRDCGFNSANYDLLADALLELARNRQVDGVVSSPYGTKYVITGAISTPVGRDVQIKSVWMVEFDSEQPRLVTAYPTLRHSK